MSAPSKDIVKASVRFAREECARGVGSIDRQVIALLADENERLRADLAAMTASFDEAADHLKRLMDERADCLSLLSGLGYQATDYCDGAEEGEDMSEECYDKTPCWAHRAAVLVAKLRSAP